MPSERIQRRIDQLLDAADEALARFDWAAVRQNAEAALLLDRESDDARTFLTAATEALAKEHTAGGGAVGSSAPQGNLVDSAAAVAVPGASMPHPGSFASGRYEVMSVLGQGGMGPVYQVRDMLLNRVAALKTIRAEHLAYPEASGRFFREAQSLARLNHPNILTLFDSGQDGDTHFLVMEMGGPDLELLLEFAAGPLPVEQVIDVGTGVARVLEYANQQGTSTAT